MSFKWKRLYDVGEHLRKYSKKEEYQRSAVGRYYYACYLIARDIYNSRLKRPDGESISHYVLINFFQDSDNKLERDIGSNLENLRVLRNNADYDNDFDKESVKNSKEYSNEFFDLIKRL